MSNATRGPRREFSKALRRKVRGEIQAKRKRRQDEQLAALPDGSRFVTDLFCPTCRKQVKAPLVPSPAAEGAFLTRCPDGHELKVSPA